MPIKRQRNLLRDLAMTRAIKDKQSGLTEVDYDRLFQLSPDGMGIIYRNGDFKIANQALVEILGGEDYRKLLGMNICDFIPANRLSEFNNYIDLLYANYGQQVRMDSEFLRFDHTVFAVDISMGSLSDSPNSLIQIIIRDITERKMVEEQLLRSNLDLEMAYHATLEGWQRFLDFRDNETGEHSRRLVEMTTNLAMTLGISVANIPHVRHGAILHDIGKIAIPDRILTKPGPLDAEEWKIMRMHPEFAYQILQPIEYLRPAIDIPYCHHEKWDGSGYPRGLKGEEIPLSARIFAVVDVWQALNSNRYYRPAWSKEDALDYIRMNANSHFDPEIVKAFVKTAG